MQAGDKQNAGLPEGSAPIGNLVVQVAAMVIKIQDILVDVTKIPGIDAAVQVKPQELLEAIGPMQQQ